MTASLDAGICQVLADGVAVDAEAVGKLVDGGASLVIRDELLATIGWQRAWTVGPEWQR